MFERKAESKCESSVENIVVRKGQPETQLSEQRFKEEYRRNFFDPHFQELSAEVERIVERAWENYSAHRKAPVTVKAGPAFTDPEYHLSVEWLSAHQKIQKAQAAWITSKNRVLVINGSPRNEHTCPGEIPKSYRMMEVALEVFKEKDFDVDVLDLSRVTSEYGKTIHPCKGCVSTSMALCHWPCSCYPNHSLGHHHDWMNEIYEKWVSAHGIMIITPVHWYQTPSVLKLMIDRLVCADGGNADPTSTAGKNAVQAKKMELAGWPYPKHLAGRAFSVVVHGDATGVNNVRHHLVDWLRDMELIPAGRSGLLEGYIGYNQPYASSHDDLDADKNFMTEVKNGALSLVEKIKSLRAGVAEPDQGLSHAIKK